MEKVRLTLLLREFMMDMLMIFKVLVRIVMDRRYFVNVRLIKSLIHNFHMTKIKES